MPETRRATKGNYKGEGEGTRCSLKNAKCRSRVWAGKLLRDGNGSGRGNRRWRGSRYIFEVLGERE